MYKNIVSPPFMSKTLGSQTEVIFDLFTLALKGTVHPNIRLLFCHVWPDMEPCFHHRI